MIASYRGLLKLGITSGSSYSPAAYVKDILMFLRALFRTQDRVVVLYS